MIAKEFSRSNDLFLIIVFQSNAKKHLIYCYQIYKLAKKKSQDVYIFSISYTRSKTSNRNFMISKKLFQVQDEGTIT